MSDKKLEPGQTALWQSSKDFSLYDQEIERFTDLLMERGVYQTFHAFSDFSERAQVRELIQQLDEEKLEYNRFLQLCKGYRSHHPFPQSRVGYGSDLWYNASRFYLSDRSERYIAAAYPMEEQTIVTFWQTLISEGSDLLLSLTTFSPFWPEEGENWSLGAGCTLSLLSDVKKGFVQRREFLVKRKEKQRVIVQLALLDWPDGGIPPTASFQSLCQAIRAERREGPTTVHCYAGIGRTGTLILYLLLEEKATTSTTLRSLYKEVWKTLLLLRLQRFGAVVQTAAQFHFCLELLLEKRLGF